MGTGSSDGPGTHVALVQLQQLCRQTRPWAAGRGYLQVPGGPLADVAESDPCGCTKDGLLNRPGTSSLENLRKKEHRQAQAADGKVLASMPTGRLSALQFSASVTAPRKPCAGHGHSPSPSPDLGPQINGNKPLPEFPSEVGPPCRPSGKRGPVEFGQQDRPGDPAGAGGDTGHLGRRQPRTRSALSPTRSPGPPDPAIYKG